MLEDKFQNHTIILASASPRRQQYFKEMGIPFKVQTIPVDEVYPPHLQGEQISSYLAALKAAQFTDTLKETDILITSDTVVWHKGISLAKPKDKAEAVQMLLTLSNDWHEVITSVCFTTPKHQETVAHHTKVKFRKLTEEEIHHYVNHYKPFDKAGGYGIQEWIGLIGIEDIQGSYSNVVGLPTHLVYKTLMSMVA
ncbi:Maf family nucleotide pyrophosphatase [Arenibacter latericius]|uniref:Maf family nucleotide pyrophosphatase n=1 Tax=Arenibacter latericius TaxID=86104 RepID=UPI0003F9F36E|nr:Maf family nucleotide pyrophosphatase [Arenibacter latericius]MDX1364252.1 Maf family nucleotide pyrophosphatase [Arenibacter latericius]